MSSNLEKTAPMPGAEETRQEAIDLEKSMDESINLADYRFMTKEEASKKLTNNIYCYVFGFYNIVSRRVENLFYVDDVKKFLDGIEAINYMEKVQKEPTNQLFAHPEEYILICKDIVKVKTFEQKEVNLKIENSVVGLLNIQSQYDYYSKIQQEEDLKEGLLKVKKGFSK